MSLPPILFNIYRLSFILKESIHTGITVRYELSLIFVGNYFFIDLVKLTVSKMDNGCFNKLYCKQYFWELTV